MNTKTWKFPVVWYGKGRWNVEPMDTTRGEERFALPFAGNKKEAAAQANKLFSALNNGSLDWYEASSGLGGTNQENVEKCRKILT